MAYKSIVITNNGAPYQEYVKRTNLYKGFSTINNSNPGSKLFDVDLIKQDLINNFQTKKGSRLMNPTFGSDIWNLFMEPHTPDIYEKIKDDIQTIFNNDPRVNATQVDVKSYEDGFIIQITFQVIATDESANISLNYNQAIGLTAQ